MAFVGFEVPFFSTLVIAVRLFIFSFRRLICSFRSTSKKILILVLFVVILFDLLFRRSVIDPVFFSLAILYLIYIQFPGNFSHR